MPQKKHAIDNDDAMSNTEFADEGVDFVDDEDDSAKTGLQSKTRHILKLELEKCRAEKQEYLAGWQRAKADLINYKREAEESREKFAKFALEDFILQLLPVLDSFELAFANAEAWERVDENWRKGVEHIHAQLLAVLKANGVEPVRPLGDEFDPGLHDSVGSVAVSDKKDDHKIVAVVQTGYALNGKPLRAPKVKVGEYKK